jgi:hypothetical protein
MQSSRGTTIANQFEIYTDEGVYFQSYATVVAFRPYKGKIQLDADKWDYSKTTSKYRNIFLRMTTKEIEAKIESGEIELIDLNK